jgi:hypothetical protein
MFTPFQFDSVSRPSFTNRNFVCQVNPQNQSPPSRAEAATATSLQSLQESMIGPDENIAPLSNLKFARQLFCLYSHPLTDAILSSDDIATAIRLLLKIAFPKLSQR